MKEAVDTLLRKRITTRRAVKSLGCFGSILLPYIIALATGKEPGRNLDAYILAAMIDPNVERDRLSSRVRNAKNEPAKITTYAEAA